MSHSYRIKILVRLRDDRVKQPKSRAASLSKFRFYLVIEYRAWNKGLHAFVFTAAAPQPVTLCLAAISATIVRRSHNRVQAFIPGPVRVWK